MATIKAFSDLEQSRKLAEFLPLESADMKYKEYTSSLDYSSKHCGVPSIGCPHSKDIPCWSLAVLEHLIWNISVDAVSCPHIYKERITNGYYVLYGNYETNTCPSIVDACYEMIIKLHELNLL